MEFNFKSLPVEKDKFFPECSVDLDKEKSLLTSLIGNEKVATKILNKFRLHELKKLDLNDCKALLDEKNADQLFAIIEFYRYMSFPKFTISDYPSRKDIGNYLYSMLAKEIKEHFVTVLFDESGKILDIKTHFIGNFKEAEANANVVFQELYRDPTIKTAHTMMIAHNHVAGGPTPSDSDVQVTKSFFWACYYMGLTLNDSLIIGPSHWISLHRDYPEIWEQVKKKGE